MNPIEILSNSCAGLTAVSDSLRAASRGAGTDVSETLDVARAILTTIVTQSTGSDPNANITEQIAEFNKMAHEKEQEFRDKMEEKTNGVSAKINEHKDQLDHFEEKIGELRKYHEKVRKRKAVEFDKENLRAVEERKLKHKAGQERLLDEQKAMFDDFDTFLAEKAMKLQQQYTAKLKQAEYDLSTVQLQLQTVIHDKHEQNRLKQTDLENENHRMASEHERLSREYHIKKTETEQKYAELQETLVTMKELMTKDAEDQANRIKLLEEEKLEERAREVNRVNQKKGELDEEIRGLKEQSLEVTLTFDKQKYDLSEEMKVEVHAMTEKIENAKQETDRMLQEANETTEKEYEEKYKLVAAEIEKCNEELEKQQHKNNDALRAYQSETAELTRELEAKNAKEINALNKILNDSKSALKKLEDDRDEALSELRKSKQNSIGAAMAEIEEYEKTRFKGINDMMRKFENEQRYLLELHQMSVEQRDKIRADEIMNLRREHDKRKQQVLNKVEQDMENEAQKRVAKSRKEESNSHKAEIGNIQERVTRVTGRVDKLAKKLDELERMTHDRILENIETTDKSLAQDLRIIARDGGDPNRGNSITQRLTNESEAVEKRRVSVLREADEITKNIETLEKSFEKKIAQIEAQYSATKQRLQATNREYDRRKSDLERRLNNQRDKMSELDKTLDARTSEAHNLESNMQQEIADFESTTKTEYEASLETTKTEYVDFEEEMNDIKNQLTQEIQSLRNQLTEARSNTSALTEYRLKVRQDELEETRIKCQLTSEERVQHKKRAHNNRVRKMEEELTAARATRDAQIIAINEDTEIQREKNRKDFEELYGEYAKERDQSITERERLKVALAKAERHECAECEKKKVSIRRILAKRDELQKKIDSMLSEVHHTEDRMYKLFGAHRPQIGAAMTGDQSRTPKVTRPTTRAQTALGTAPRSLATSPRHI